MKSKWSVRTHGPIILSSAILLLFLPISSHAIEITLEWDSVGADHYIVYWGVSSENYTDNSNNYSGSPITTTSYSLTLADPPPPNNAYYFAVTAVYSSGIQSNYSREVYVLGPNHPHLDPAQGYDRGWGITDVNSPLNGLKFIFSSNDVTPTLGPSASIPPISNVYTVGDPLNLQPSGIPFSFPVKAFIPCATSDVSKLNVYYWDSVWMLANDANNPYSVQPGAENWLVEGSRVNHDSLHPHTIEIHVYHFSGVQAGIPSSAISSEPVEGGGGGGGGCFIGTAGR